MREAQVYYFYDADDWCLYVGCSLTARWRVAYHRKHAYWRRHIDGGRVEFAPPMEHEDALKLEREEIRRLGPAFNLRDNYARDEARRDWFRDFEAAWESAQFRVPGVTYYSYQWAFARAHPHPGAPPDEQLIAELQAA